MIVMSNPDFMDWLEKLRQVSAFQLAVAPSDKQSEEQYDLELVVRFLVLRGSSEESLSQFKDLRELLTGQVLSYAEDSSFPYEATEDRFMQTFRILNDALDGSAFRRYDSATDRFLGGFSVSSFEVVTVGVSAHINLWETATTAQVRAKVGSVWSHEEFKRYGGGGINPTTRIPRTVALGRSLFASLD